MFDIPALRGSVSVTGRCHYQTEPTVMKNSLSSVDLSRTSYHNTMTMTLYI